MCRKYWLTAGALLVVVSPIVAQSRVIELTGETTLEPSTSIDPDEVVAQSAVIDLTGETCLGSSTSIDPDANGPLPAFTYCLMNGRIGANEAIEMDDIDGLPPVSGSAASVQDANLVSGANANNPDLPLIPGATYIDWADLDITNLTGTGAAPLGSVEDHRIVDWTANGDFTMLKPQNASCLNSGSVLPKEDFTQSYIANNSEYLYVAQERRTNNGNSVYYWLLTHEPPIVKAVPECSNARGQLQFNLSHGDVELLVNFPDSNDPAGGGVFFRMFMDDDPTGYIPAQDAVFNAGWGGLETAPIHNIALSIRDAVQPGDDSYGPWGGINSQGNPVATGTYLTAQLAEWAVSLEDIFPDGGLCGQSLFLSGLSRASTGQVDSLTESAALKDSVGPKLYSFGQISATAELTPSCTLTFDYVAHATGIDGQPLDAADFTCTWECSGPDGRDPNIVVGSCDEAGSIPLGDATPADVTCTVTVTETDSGCTAEADDSTTVLAPITVSIAPGVNALSCTVPSLVGSDAGDIGGGVVYTPTISGGDGAYTRSWTVSGPNAATCAADATTCTVDIPDAAFCGKTEVKVQVDDGNALCPAVTSNTGTVQKTTSVTAN